MDGKTAYYTVQAAVDGSVSPTTSGVCVLRRLDAVDAVLRGVEDLAVDADLRGVGCRIVRTASMRRICRPWIRTTTRKEVELDE